MMAVLAGTDDEEIMPGRPWAAPAVPEVETFRRLYSQAERGSAVEQSKLGIPKRGQFLKLDVAA
jgi:hypothetical protein